MVMYFIKTENINLSSFPLYRNIDLTKIVARSISLFRLNIQFLIKKKPSQIKLNYIHSGCFININILHDRF